LRLRVQLIFTICFLIWCSLLLRAAYIQLLPNDRLENSVKKQYQSHLLINARRGAILDRNGQELAVSTTSYSLYADPKIIDKPKKLAKILAPYVGYSPIEINRKIADEQKRFVWLKRHLDFSEKEKIEALKLNGIGFIEESKRFYPNGKLLSPVLGFVGADGTGLEGLELFYNEELKGQKLKVSLPKDARGRPLMLPHEILVTDPNGENIELTIDRDLQFDMEQELMNAVAKFKAEGAWGIMLDPKTSEVLAMASVPHFDPNNPAEVGASKYYKNRVVTDVYEPGSTMKTILVAGGLRDKMLSPNKTYYCEKGFFKIGKRVIGEAESSHRFENLTVTDILGFSSNIGAAKIALEMGAKKYRNLLEEFGFGKKTGIDFQGESAGLLSGLPWNEHLLSNIGFGHGTAVSAVQIANAYAAIANGGELYQPYLVKSIRGAGNNFFYQSSPKLIRRVLPVDVAEQTTLMLTTVTGAGRTGESARVLGYPVAGKTGTAQKVNPSGRGYLEKAYISSFAGYLPANNPQIVIYVAVDNPHTAYYASEVAAPVFAKVAARAVRHLGISPNIITESDVLPSHIVAKKKGKKKKTAIRASIDSNVMPDLRGLTLREVYRQLHPESYDISWHGRGTVRQSTPAPGELLPKDNKVRLVLGFDEN
jgi:cell division protein FtsI (penicillin-binding protein 3)